jgi:signal transduction histidine kinase
MSVDSVAEAKDQALRLRYRAYNSEKLAYGLMVLSGLSVLVVPGGFVLDYFLYPHEFLTFLGVRLATAAFLILLIGVLYLERKSQRLTVIKSLGVLSALSVNSAMCFMIYRTEGAKSPYFVGLILVLTCWSILSPWTVVETASMCFLSILAFLLACILNPDFEAPGSIPLLGFGGFFLVITATVCIGITFYLAKARFEEFRLRHQLDEQNRELQDLDRLKTQFFSNVSHELRTPLTLILGPVETILSRSEALDQKVHDGIILIHRNALRLLKLINDLLDLTRLDQGAEVLRKREIPTTAFIKGIVDSVRHLGLSKNLRMKIEERQSSVKLIADPSRLEKVLVNLLTNALKYTPSGGLITVRWFSRDRETCIEVEDTGVGIAEDELPRIFDRFHQVRSNLANRSQGVGIGLALAKELVVEHGGRIEVESMVGQGSTFRVCLPLDDGAEGIETLEPGAAGAGDEPFEQAFRSADRSWRSAPESGSELEFSIVGQGEKTVLVADDEPDMRNYVVSLLADKYRVIQTPDGVHVSALVAEHKPAIVLLDWMMPGRDGLTVCQELRASEQNSDLKIVLLTARVDEQSKIDALQAGADDFLTKPFSSIEVLTRIDNLLRSVRLQADLRARNDELLAAMEKLKSTEIMLIQSEKMNAIGSLSAGLMHEINNPLNYTLAAVSFAKQFQGQLSPEMQEVIADIEEGMTRVSDVVTNLKTFAYPERAGVSSVFTLEEVLQSARKIMARDLQGIEVRSEIPAGLAIQGQKTQMIHLFINLFANAARAIQEKPGGGTKEIAVSATVAGDTVRIDFADSGPGIPEMIIGRIFEPFFTTRDVGSGMGMGLSICHTIMEAHHGSITADNRPGGGAVFTITLPLAEH